MRIKNGFILRKIADEYLVVAIGDEAKAFHGAVVLNEVSAFVLENLKDNISEESLVERVIEAYDVDYKTASTDVHAFINTLNENGMLE